MALSLKHYVPLLQVLSELKDYQRQIVVDHLNNESCGSILDSIVTVLKNDTPVKSARKSKLKKIVRDNYGDLSMLLKGVSPNSRTGKRVSKKQRAILAKLGGNPLLEILTNAIPLLLPMLL